MICPTCGKSTDSMQVTLKEDGTISFIGTKEQIDNLTKNLHNITDVEVIIKDE